MERREHDVWREHYQRQDEPDDPGEQVHCDERADDRDHHCHPSVEEQPVTMNAHRTGDERRHSQESREVEDVRPNHDADAGVLMSSDDRGDG